MEEKKTTEELIQGIKDFIAVKEISKLLVVKWVHDNSDLGLKGSKDLVDEHFHYPKEE